MIQLVSRTLSADTDQHLNQLQIKVDSEPIFHAKVGKAETLWNGKKKSKKGKKAFDEIVSTLKQMCVSVEVCNYCEQNEANDIEHIYPKSLFPELAFIWRNYLLACKQCNTAYKLDAFAVFDADGNLIDIPRGTQPLHVQGAFINPRIENPSDFFVLTFPSFKFEILANPGTVDYFKAEKTIEILQLNDRDTLLQARKAAAKYFYHRIDLLHRALLVKDKQDFFDLLNPHDERLNHHASLHELQTDLKREIKEDIQTHQHPSVWYAIKLIASKTEPKWQNLFQALPEVLHW